jgi:hypothetical protein
VAQHGDLDRDDEQLLFQVVRAVADATHAGDPYMVGHSTRVAAYCEQLAASLELPPRDRLLLFLAAAFHDIGYLATPAYILRKPSVLAEDEMEEVRIHPVRGARVFAAEPGLSDIARAIRHHHERFDGSGYPDGLRGEEIPLFRRAASAPHPSTLPRPLPGGPARRYRVGAGVRGEPGDGGAGTGNEKRALDRLRSVPQREHLRCPATWTMTLGLAPGHWGQTFRLGRPGARTSSASAKLRRGMRRLSCPGRSSYGRARD